MELKLENVKKSFGEKQVLNGVSYSFQKGHIYGLLGRNGAGKTTLFNCVSGEMELDEGSVDILSDGQSHPISYENIGYAFSTPILPEFMTGYEFIKFFLDINKKNVQNPLAPEQYADMVRLERSDLDRLVKGYSHGMKNKLQMLCLLIAKQPVILLDEPLTSLDVVAAHEMKQMLLEMKEDHIIILSTHILQLAQDLCDEIVLLHNGQLSEVNEDHHGADFEQKVMDLLCEEGGQN